MKIRKEFKEMDQSIFSVVHPPKMYKMICVLVQLKSDAVDTKPWSAGIKVFLEHAHLAFLATYQFLLIFYGTSLDTPTNTKLNQSIFFNCSLLRNSRKILTLPSIDSNSSDHVFSKVLLFSPDAQEEMDVKLLRDLYTKYDEPPVKDVFGNDQTMIDRIER